jgi:hypothetical protein
MVNFSNRPSLAAFLGRVLVEGRLALFLGAGISAKLQETSPGVWFGLPQWDKFVDNLFLTKSKRRPAGFDSLRAAEFFRSLCKGNGDYRECIRRALYREFKSKTDVGQFHKNSTLAAIGALVANSQRSRVSRVVTLNFDDILERYLGHSGIVVKSVFASKYWHQAADVTIHHLHGFIPSPGSPYEKLRWNDDSNEVILDAFSYQRVFGDPDNRFSLIAKDVMMSNYCLFLGLSDQDDHLGALLARSKDSNPFQSEGNGYWGVSFTSKWNSAQAEYWKTRGVYLQRVADWHTDFPAFLFSICQNAARFRT